MSNPEVSGLVGSPQAATPMEKPLAKWDLRLRSLDREPFESVSVCCAPDCGRIAEWSVWLHTPEWGDHGGATYVRCHSHALSAIDKANNERRQSC